MAKPAEITEKLNRVHHPHEHLDECRFAGPIAAQRSLLKK
jgi:hypothetical protein